MPFPDDGACDARAQVVVGGSAGMIATNAIDSSVLAPTWAILNGRARAYVEAARAPATLRAYAADWRAANGVDALPATPHRRPVPVGSSGPAATLRRKLAAIAVMHRAAGHDSPTEHGMVRGTFAGIGRERGIAPRPKTALLVTNCARRSPPAANAASTYGIAR